MRADTMPRLARDLITDPGPAGRPSQRETLSAADLRQGRTNTLQSNLAHLSAFIDEVYGYQPVHRPAEQVRAGSGERTVASLRLACQIALTAAGQPVPVKAAIAHHEGGALYGVWGCPVNQDQAGPGGCWPEPGEPTKISATLAMNARAVCLT